MEKQKKISVKPNFKQPSRPFIHTWEGLGNIDQMRWMTRKDCLAQLEEAHRDLGLNHIRAVGLFDDHLFVVGKDPKNFNTENAPPRNNWQLIDYIFDSLLDIGINPVFTTCFMPEALASGEQYVFDTKNNVTTPRSYKAWAELVKATLEHMISRYGKKRMSQWYYEVWNEPNLGAFFGGTKEDFFKLWEVTWKTIKEADVDFRVGGPSTARAEWIPEFLAYASETKSNPDYLIAHIYNNDSEYAALSPFAGPQSDKINKSPNFLSGVINGVKKLAEEHDFNGEIHWNEWGRSWFPSDPMRESANEAAFIVKSMAEVSQEATYFAYWCLSDIYNQAGYGAETFHGNYGMLNLQGLKKPSYFAHQLLTKLGKETIPADTDTNLPYSNAIVTQNKNNISVLFYSYDSEYEIDSYQETTLDAQIIFDRNTGIKKVSAIPVSVLENNILHTWKEKGSPAYLNYDERETWKELNQLKESSKIQVKNLDDKTLVEFKMTIPGIALLTIEL